MRGVNPTFTFRSERSLANENSEAVQMQTLATLDLFINSLEHHELQKEGNFSPPPKFAASVNTVACLSLLSYIPGGLQQKMRLNPQTQGPIQSSGTSSHFAAVHEGAVLQSKSPVPTQSFRLLLVVLPHGNNPWTRLPRGKIPNQVKWLRGHLPPRREVLGTASQAAFILLFQLSPT